MGRGENGGSLLTRAPRCSQCSPFVSMNLPWVSVWPLANHPGNLALGQEPFSGHHPENEVRWFAQIGQLKQEFS